MGALNPHAAATLLWLAVAGAVLLALAVGLAVLFQPRDGEGGEEP